MVNFKPTEEQELIRDTMAGFAREVLRPQAREADESCDVPASVVERAWELGLVQNSIPEAQGGYGNGRSAVRSAIKLEELAYGDLALALLVLTPRLVTVPLIVSGTDAHEMATSGFARRVERLWIARATSSLPVPLSPVTSTRVSCPATRRIVWNTSRMPREVPMIPSSRVARPSCSFSERFSASTRRCSWMRRSSSTTVSFGKGLSRYSYAPAFIASTADSTVP